jgi:uncharacterized protein (TIGR02594 family)
MLKFYGLKEVFGPVHNPEIIKMFHEIGYNWINDDETAWCSAALNYFCYKLGYKRSGKLDARSWLNLPMKVEVPEMGDIVILWRNSPTSWTGHVGLYISEDKETNRIYVLGGNQDNMINIKPYYKSQVLGYRRTEKEFLYVLRKKLIKIKNVLQKMV